MIGWRNQLRPQTSGSTHGKGVPSKRMPEALLREWPIPAQFNVFPEGGHCYIGRHGDKALRAACFHAAPRSAVGLQAHSYLMVPLLGSSVTCYGNFYRSVVKAWRAVSLSVCRLLRGVFPSGFAILLKHRAGAELKG
jgi:hypothetical protein